MRSGSRICFYQHLTTTDVPLTTYYLLLATYQVRSVSRTCYYQHLTTTTDVPLTTYHLLLTTYYLPGAQRQPDLLLSEPVRLASPAQEAAQPGEG